jgi:transcriptional regulator with XRE-family HTH domain
MNFGDWINKLRNDQDLTLVELASQAGMTHPALIFIETGESRPTLTSAKRLCQVLGVTVSDLVSVVQNREPLRYLEADFGTRKGMTLNLDDVEAFLEVCDISVDQAELLLMALINRIARLYPALVQQANVGVPKLSIANIQAMVSDSPFHVSYLKFPNTTAEMVWQTFKQSGVLMSRDTMVYIQETFDRHESIPENTKLVEKVIRSLKRRATRDLAVQFVLEDILALDLALADEGEILAMFWRIAELGELLEERDEREERLVSILIKAYRWWQHLVGWEDQSWLEHLRSGIEEAQSVPLNEKVPSL